MREVIDRKTLFVSDGGGTLDFVSDDGEVLASVAVPAGRVSALPYLDLVPLGATLQVASGVAVIRPPHRIGIQKYGDGSHDSGANPDYRPTAASRMEKEMRLTLSRIQNSEKRVDAKLKALSKIDRVPDAPAVVDPIEKAPITPDPVEQTPEVKPTDG